MSVIFSIVIPTYNRPERLGECLDAVERLDYPKDEFEVIVVDDGGRTSLAPIVEASAGTINIRLLRQENAGPAAARNAGAAAARGEILAFTDDDCRPDPHWLRELAGAIENASDKMFGGRTVNVLTSNPFSSASQKLIDYLYAYYNAAGDRASFFTSNNMAMRRDLFLGLDGFSPAFRRAAGEDREFCDRWQRAGFELEYVPSALVYHAHHLDARGFLRQHFNYGRAAYDFHRDRLARHRARLTPEPPRFYVDLVRFPLRQADGLRSWLESGLLVASQVANAAGYFWAKWQVGRTEV